MSQHHSMAERFRELHDGSAGPLLMPNAWDAGSARVLASLGFQAIASTSSGFAATLGRRDGNVSCDEVLEHCGKLSAAVEIPVSADLENGFADDPTAVARTVRRAAATGLAGCSIEDYSGDPRAPIYPIELAAERVAAAVDAAHEGPTRLVLTARAENHVRGREDLDDTIARLQAFQDAGADVLFAPGLSDVGDIRRMTESLHRPVNVLIRPGGPTVAELAEVGVRRISVGGAFAFAALSALHDAASELRDQGTCGFWGAASRGIATVRDAFI